MRRLHWKLVLAHLVVSFLAIAATMAIFPGITIEGDFWIWCAVLGAVFGLLNALVKPALQIVTLRYLFLSYGLILILINLATFWLLEVFVDRLDIDTFWDLLGGSILIGLLVTLLENVSGLTPPIVDRQSTPAPDGQA